MTQKGDFFMIACDGVWDVLSNEQAVQFVKEKYATEKDLNKVAQLLGDEAIAK
jgi:serine/threonine protein phosphatase PrpC